ncbi:hypothetical protein GWI33_002376 [Rhynchophorus ferrugineus]|uniref:Uncharacterized protein n=1 Tax=Rhynchophorus ferrugineus TaxID=354439 RepID=A0A834IKC3_RHYFE|nr:hypothetical protein GWI33_002376 [Rhynchophorus ferrugineus]
MRPDRYPRKRERKAHARNLHLNYGGAAATANNARAPKNNRECRNSGPQFAINPTFYYIGTPLVLFEKKKCVEPAARDQTREPVRGDGDSDLFDAMTIVVWSMPDQQKNSNYPVLCVHS